METKFSQLSGALCSSQGILRASLNEVSRSVTNILCGLSQAQTLSWPQSDLQPDRLISFAPNPGRERRFFQIFASLAQKINYEGGH